MTKPFSLLFWLNQINKALRKKSNGELEREGGAPQSEDSRRSL